MQMNRTQEEKNIFWCVVAAVNVQVSLFVVVAFAEMLDMVRGCVGRHEVEAR